MVKWIEMASQSKSSIETNRWVWTLQNAITIAKDNIKRETLTANVEVPRHQQQSNWQQQMKQILNMNTAMNQRKTTPS